MATAREIVYEYATTTAASDAVGELQRLAARRYLDDLKRSDIVVNWVVVERALQFFKHLSHSKGRHAGEAVTLQPWQVFIVANILGWEWRETHRRRYIESYIEVARKNGKTFLATCLCLYYLVADGEQGAEVDLAANSREQARIAFDYCKSMARQLDESGRALRRRRTDIVYERTNSVLNCFAADDSTLDGFNASFALIDEYHAAKNSRVRDVLNESMGMRENPHICTITTAGFDKHSPCYELHTVCCEVLKGVKQDDTLFAAIFAPDEGDDWTLPATWRKASPNMGVTVYEDYISNHVSKAINAPSQQMSCKTKLLNMWCDTVTVWLPADDVMTASERVEFADGEVLHVGVDLAATGDLTAVSYATERDDGYYFRVDYYLPSARLENGPLAANYQRWHALGLLHVTDGNVTDYDAVTRDLMAVAAKNRIASVNYDAWNATQWALQATAQGLPLVPYSQTIGSFNRPTKELERAVLGGRAHIDINEVTRWCFSNVALKVDHSENCKPSKTAYDNKIDGVIALLMALGGVLQQPTLTPSIFVI